MKQVLKLKIWIKLSRVYESVDEKSLLLILSQNLTEERFQVAMCYIF